MASSAKAVVCIVTPGTRDANNGNWRTAARWSQMLRERFQVIVQTEWDAPDADAMIALHARRSAGSIGRFRGAHPRRPLAVVLTGTDLYRDLPGSAEAVRSLDAADRIVVLQDDALRLLEARWQRKAEVIFQSARPLAPRRKSAHTLGCAIVGHLRPEKDPATLFAAIAKIPADVPITFRHIGAPLDASLADEARELARRDPRFRYAGALPHGLTRAAIASAHLLVHPSRMEGGANVVVEAVTAATPVLASRISGNVGMLGAHYPGYFEPGDAAALARCLVQAAQDKAYLARLKAACVERRPLFSPRNEQRAITALVAGLLE